MNNSFLIILVLLILFCAQALYTLNSTNQIRVEELSESVRNVYYLENGLIFSGINAHLGWYTPMRLIYNTFGFEFEYVKYFRLTLHLVSIICLALFLKNILGFKKSLIPLITIGLSPTLLFFNSLRTHYGVDLQYLPIILYFLTRLNFKGSILPHILVWSLSIIAWSAYPTFVYYLPSIAIFYMYGWLKNKGSWKYILISSLSFLTPLVLMILQVSNKEILISDPSTGGGLFRGAGYFAINPLDSILRIYYTFLGFLGKADSYYYEVSQPDFSLIFPLVSIITTIYLTGKFFLKGNRLIVSLIFLPALINLLILAFFTDNSGFSSVRRASGAVASFYGFYILAFFSVVSNFKKRYFMIILLLLLPLHHLMVYPVNLAHIQDESPYKETIWFNGPKTPKESLEKYIEKIKKEDLKLHVVYPDDVDFGYVYNWIYSAVAGKCYWDKLNCHKIFGFDINQGKFIELNTRSVNYTY